MTILPPSCVVPPALIVVKLFNGVVEPIACRLVPTVLLRVRAWYPSIVFPNRRLLPDSVMAFVKEIGSLKV